MSGTLTEKIVLAHLSQGQVEPGQEIDLVIDQTLTQDATGTMAYLQWEAIGLDKVQTELSAWPDCRYCVVPPVSYCRARN